MRRAGALRARGTIRGKRKGPHAIQRYHGTAPVCIPMYET